MKIMSKTRLGVKPAPSLTMVVQCVEAGRTQSSCATKTAYLHNGESAARSPPVQMDTACLSKVRTAMVLTRVLGMGVGNKAAMASAGWIHIETGSRSRGGRPLQAGMLGCQG